MLNDEPGRKDQGAEEEAKAGWVRSQVMVSLTPCWRVIFGLPSTA